eukprot:CAMPEP_0167769210 /NCGR_PEP_ID=MMETSP0110_2-20121227/17171_1 /TAXON_ID=629695 /ORGANISM="Gymnochlora sp., Strain CCMP2014" /LENGTH=380 /DNA_ID=CAMNT_0007658119 /DNA_START=590 /DNA_END=1729 /DNA_ORIENTATION=+
MASNRSMESLTNYEMVKYFNREKHESKRYDEALQGANWAAVVQQTTLAILNAGQGVILSGGLTAMMLLACRGIMNGDLTPGDLVLVNSLLYQLSIPLNMFGTVYRETAQSLIDMETMMGLLEKKTKIKDKKNAVEITGQGDIVFSDVTFGYNNDRKVLDKLNVEVKRGQKVAFVGSSGSGKSTILRLLYRFYDIDGGKIMIDGVDIRDIKIDSLRKAISVVPQDTVLFNESIRYNLEYGQSPSDTAALSEEKFTTVVKQARIYDSVSNMPEGFDTVVGERGLKLSGGEKQRVAIARAMFKDSPIMFYDEATSALDSENESEILSHLRDLGEGRTTLVIAHRLSTVQDADKIFVLDKGKIVESGTHNSLVSQPKGIYAKMW